jgi:aspartate 1-decarboxylase
VYVLPSDSGHVFGTPDEPPGVATGVAAEVATGVQAYGDPDIVTVTVDGGAASLVEGADTVLVVAAADEDEVVTVTVDGGASALVEGADTVLVVAAAVEVEVDRGADTSLPPHTLLLRFGSPRPFFR